MQRRRRHAVQEEQRVFHEVEVGGVVAEGAHAVDRQRE